MRIFDEDNDIGTIGMVVAVTLVLGAIVYTYTKDDGFQTALLPAIDKTVPTIVPAGPQI
jgi:hypothetical protein